MPGNPPRGVVGAGHPRHTPPPADAPAEGMYVLSSVNADGRSRCRRGSAPRRPISELRLTTTDPDLLRGSVESLDLLVHDVDGILLAHRDSIGTNPQQVRLRTAPPTSIQLHDRRRDGRRLADRADPNPGPGAGHGRRLRRRQGLVRRVVTATGTVITSPACARPTTSTSPAPLPASPPATATGSWISRRRPTRRLLAQAGELDRRWAEV